MAVGNSGRILADIDPDLKSVFYKMLKASGLDFKTWLLDRINKFLNENENKRNRHFKK